VRATPLTADRSGVAGVSVYSMSKGAVAALTRGHARDLGPRGITANVIQPGKDVEIASLVADLASLEASFITGAAITIDGGYLA
jgi:3-oxoacyl-[acyl-carrier protein] reductase